MVLLKFVLPRINEAYSLYLHSTMVLLKSVVNTLVTLWYTYLHSTMVLLKSEQINDILQARNESTFHYGSIKIKDLE